MLLPPEPVPADKGCVKTPCALLVKALYGHPQSNAHWQTRLTGVLNTHMGGYESANTPSVILFEKMTSMVMSVYVDDLTLAGKEERHANFWSTLSIWVKLDPFQERGRVLGRDHSVVREGLCVLALESAVFAKQCVELYEELSESTAKQFPTPQVEESLVINEARGQLSTAAARLVMKLTPCMQSRSVQSRSLSGLCDDKRIACVETKHQWDRHVCSDHPDQG